MHPPSSPHTPAPGGGWQQMMTFQPTAPVPDNVTRRPLLRQIVLWGAIVALFGLTALSLGTMVIDSIGLATAGLALVTAALALGIVVPTFLWVDRLEAEPPRILWFAFLWGALVATFGAIILNQLGVEIIDAAGADAMRLAPVFVAPVTEELLKGLGVAILFFRVRREFNGITDGIVYAGIIAAGFAFVENILYLGRAYVEIGTPGLVALFIMRCLVSPFAHPMFTICIGLAFGAIAHRRRLSSVWLVLLGFAGAIFLHFLWNYSAVVAAEAYLLVFAVVQIPLFIGFILLLRWSRRRESRLMRDVLTGYGMNGWFTPAEVAMLTDAGERRRARRWASGVGGRRAARAMTAFQDESGDLAMVRKHLNSEGPDAEWLRREEALLRTITAHRQVFVPGASAPGTAAPTA
ncbi:PrsW family intramembrane metalloprotease [Ornithinimicrobium panacihumi]|uniref:PrsW family intramembrane metalloprotease n=1 Tax=Ornithinimicrobium panacihumi TaxID=2008449 RepID=UPI003F888F2D